MPKRSLPQYCLHRGSGQAYVRIDGKREYLGKHNSPESHRRYAALIEKWQRTAEAAPTDITIRQLTMMYSEWAKGHYVKNGKPTSQLHTVKAALRALNQQCRNLPATELTPRRFKAVRESLIELGTLCRTTINDYMGVIRALVKWAVAEEILPPEKLVALQAVRDLQKGRTAVREPAPVKPVPEADINAVLPHVSRQVKDMIRLQLLSGCRPEEVVRFCNKLTCSSHYVRGGRVNAA